MSALVLLMYIHMGVVGSDTMYATFEDLNTISKATLKTGVTSFLPTTMTMPVDDITKAIDNIATYKDQVEGAQIFRYTSGRTFL